jgi:hypothetical protein
VDHNTPTGKRRDQGFCVDHLGQGVFPANLFRSSYPPKFASRRLGRQFEIATLTVGLAGRGSFRAKENMGSGAARPEALNHIKAFLFMGRFIIGTEEQINWPIYYWRNVDKIGRNSRIP